MAAEAEIAVDRRPGIRGDIVDPRLLPFRAGALVVHPDLSGVVAADQDLPAARDGRGGRGVHGRRGGGGRRFLPPAVFTAVDPGVVQRGGLVVAAEHDRRPGGGVVDDGGVAAERGLGFAVRPAPRVCGAVVDPGRRAAGGVGRQAAAEQDDFIMDRVVAQRGPGQCPAAGGMVSRRQVRPGVVGRVEGEGAPVGIADDAVPPRIETDHVERVNRARPPDPVEVPPADPVGAVVSADHLQPGPLVEFQTVRAGLPVDAKAGEVVRFPLTPPAVGEGRPPGGLCGIKRLQLVAAVDVAGRLLAPGPPQVQPVCFRNVDRPGERLAPRPVLPVDRRPLVGREARVVGCAGPGTRAARYNCQQPRDRVHRPLLSGRVIA